MAIGSPGLLKASLWLQAVVLLVLTSMLASAGAWIGAILTAVGCCFSLIGIGAAHKRSMGYLYCYTTLMGAWSLLAVTHVLIVCGLIALPESLMDEVLVVGERILVDSADPMKIVIPSLYGVQCFAWCGSLACIALTRAAASDPTLGFEIQSPATIHRLEMARQQRVNRQQSIFGFRRPSTISPIGSCEHGTKLPQKDFATQKKFRDGVEEDGQKIIIPNGRRISQVIVTFRSDFDSIQMDTTKMDTEIHTPEADVVSPQRSSTIYITNHNYSPKDSTYTSIPFTLPGESFSDMIFSAVQTEQPITRVPPPKAQEKIPQPEQGPSVQRRSQEQEQEQEQEEPRPSESSNRTVSTVASTTDTKSAIDIATLSSTTTLDEGLDAHGSFDLDREPHPKVSSILSKYQVQQLEKMQQQRQHQHHHQQSTWQLLMEQDRKQHMEKQQAVQHVTFPIVPTRRSSFHQYYEKEMDISSPAIQPNSSDPSISAADRHIPTIATTTGVFLPNDQPPSPGVSPISASRSKSSMLKYWKKNRSSGSSVSSEESSITQGYFTNAFSNKKSKTKPAIIVPSIVLHPDEEDGEPPRVLSQKDIEYLSTAPPVPLRPLIQPWDEPEEGHDGYGDGYDYDYDYDSYHQEEEEEVEESEESEEGDEHRHHQLVEGEYDDPYALDVPINLEIDLQGLEHGEVKGYSYI